MSNYSTIRELVYVRLTAVETALRL